MHDDDLFKTEGIKGVALIALTTDGRVRVIHDGLGRYLGPADQKFPTDDVLYLMGQVIAREPIRE